MASDKIERESLLSVSALTSVTAEVIALETELKNLLKIYKDFAKENPLKNGDDFKKFKAGAADARTTIDSLNKTTKERVRLQDDLKRANSTAIDQNEILKLQLQRQRKVNKELAREKLGLITAYDKESKRLVKLRKDFKKTAIEMGLNSKEARKLQKEITVLDTKLKKVDAAAGQFQRSVGNYTASIRSLGSVLKTTLSAFGLVSGIQIFARAISNAAKTIVAFQKSNAELAGVLQTNRAGVKELTEDAKRLGSVTAKTATEVSQLQIAYARLGFSQKEILELTESTIDGSIALNAELGDTAELTGAVVRQFTNLGTQDAPGVLDKITKSTQKSSLNFTKLQTALPKVGKAASALGISFSTVLSQLSIAQDATQDASIAGTGLRKVYTSLASKGLTLSEALTKINNSSNRVNASVALFGERAFTVGIALADNIEKTKELEIAYDNAGGTAERVAKVQLDTLEGELKLLSSAYEGFILSVENGEGVIGKAALGFIEFATFILGAVSPVESLSSKFFELQESVNSLEENINPLLDRYDKLTGKTDKLTGKTELSVEEQTELKNIIIEVGNEMPSVVTEFDKYGKALGLSTVAARNFIEEQKNILKLKNKEAIEDEEDAIESLTKIFNTHALTLEKQDGKFVKIIRSYTKLGTEIRTVVALTDDEINNRVKQREEISQEIETRTAIIAKLQGEQTEKEKLAKISRQESEATTSLIEAQENLLKQAKKLPESTEKELVVKNRRIKQINTEISRLKALGVEKEKQAKDQEKLEKAEIARLEKQADVRNAIRQEEIKGRIDQIDDQVKDEKELFELRKSALIQQANFELSLTGKTAEEKFLIEVKLQNDLAELIRTRAENASKENEKFAKKEQDDFDASVKKRGEAAKKEGDELAEKQKKEGEDNKKRDEERLERSIKTTELITDSVDQALQEQSQRNIEKIERDQEENDEELETQKRRDELGLENSLAFQEQKSADLELKKQEEAKKEETRQLALAYVSALTSFAKEDDPEQAPFKAAAVVALGKVVGGLFYDGSDRLGDDVAGSPIFSGKDNLLIRANPEERLVGHDDSIRLRSHLGNISNTDLVDLAIRNAKPMDMVVAGMDTTDIVQGLAQVKKAVESSGMKVNWDSHDNRIEQKIENGVNKRTYYKSGGRIA